MEQQPRQEMPFWEKAFGTGLNYISHVPIFNTHAPTFGQGFQQGVVNQTLHGNLNPLGRYAAHRGEGIAGALVGGALAGPPGAFIGGKVAPWLADHVAVPIIHGISNMFHHEDAPIYTNVSVGDINNPGVVNGDRTYIDQSTGNVYSGSQYGPWQDGYQMPDGQQSAPNEFTMPDFSAYSDPDGNGANTNYVEVPNVQDGGGMYGNGADAGGGSGMGGGMYSAPAFNAWSAPGGGNASTMNYASDAMQAGFNVSTQGGGQKQGEDLWHHRKAKAV